VPWGQTVNLCALSRFVAGLATETILGFVTVGQHRHGVKLRKLYSLEREMGAWGHGWASGIADALCGMVKFAHAI
jgi:hypothetical protein